MEEKKEPTTMEKSLKGFTCESLHCGKSAELHCPRCENIGIDSYFCSQDCFKKSYPTHKLKHKKSPDTYDPWPTYRFTGKLRPFPASKSKAMLFPDKIPQPDYAQMPDGVSACEEQVKYNRKMNEIKELNEEEQELLRTSAQLGRRVLNEVAKVIGVGVTTDEIDRVVYEFCVDNECYPSPLNYYNFPKSCCTSVNEVICHGIPDSRPIVDGDIVNVDITVFKNNFHGDLNETFLVGNVDEKGRKLVNCCYEALQEAISEVRPGVKYRQIGNIIQKHVAREGFTVVRSYCGHGIHNLFHTSPNVPHYAKNKATGTMKPGHAFTIEPMINEGSFHDVVWPDNWTAVTNDGKRSAQLEETLLVTETGVQILTKRQDNNGLPYFMDRPSTNQ